jgi:hypothetical protein
MADIKSDDDTMKKGINEYDVGNLRICLKHIPQSTLVDVYDRTINGVPNPLKLGRHIRSGKFDLMTLHGRESAIKAGVPIFDVINGLYADIISKKKYV